MRTPATLGFLRTAALRRVAASGVFLAACFRALAHAAEEGAPQPIERQINTAKDLVLVLGGGLVVLILGAIAVMVFRKAFGSSRAEESPAGAAESADPLAEAVAEEKRGNFSAAANRYKAAGEHLKAADCWEKLKDYARAAEACEAGGDMDRAAQFHVRSGGALRAAGIYMRTKNYIEAAKIFRNKGDHLRAAQALELYGNKIAAAREYSAGGDHAHAARVLKEERLFAEAAEAYRPLIGGDVPTAATADRQSTYASLIELAGERERAIAIYQRVLAAAPGQKRALAALQKLLPQQPPPPSPSAAPAGAARQPLPVGADVSEYEFLEPETPAGAPAGPSLRPPAPPPAPQPTVDETAPENDLDAALDEGDPLKRVFTLRSMIHAGRMEPRYSMRLWVQIMRALAERHRANAVLGCLTPESIGIDMENNVHIESPSQRPPVYLAPEVQAGLPPDRQADIYSMGVILYELVTDSLDQLGKKRAGELFQDVPPWLDELIERCTEKNLTKRYRTTEEVSAALQRLKSASPE